MKKFLLLFATSLLLISCQDKNEVGFWEHPEILQKYLKKCPDSAPKGFSCAQLQEIADNMQVFAYELRLSPQGFGKRILELQHEIAQQEHMLKNDPNQGLLKVKIEKNKLQLARRLAIVKQFESPGG